MILAQYRAQMRNQVSARLIMHELLDNEQRAERAGNWYLKPYLEELVKTVRASASGSIGRPEALAMVYQFLGAAHYIAVSQPTLSMMFGKKLMGETTGCYEDKLRRLIRSTLQR